MAMLLLWSVAAIGYSYKSFPKTPIELIAERLPRTLMLFAIVNIVSFYTGFFIGKILAWRRGSKSETWITLTSVFSYTVFYKFKFIFLFFIKYFFIKFIIFKSTPIL